MLVIWWNYQNDPKEIELRLKEVDRFDFTDYLRTLWGNLTEFEFEENFSNLQEKEMNAITNDYMNTLKELA